MFLLYSALFLIAVVAPFIFRGRSSHPVPFPVGEDDVDRVAVFVGMIRFYFDVVAIVFGLAGDASAVTITAGVSEFRQRLAAAWNGLTRPTSGARRPSQVHDGDHPFRRVAPNDDFDWTQVPDITESEADAMPELIPAPEGGVPVLIPHFNQMAHSQVSEVSSVSSIMSDATFVSQPCTGSLPVAAPAAAGPSNLATTSAVPPTTQSGIRLVAGKIDVDYAETDLWYAVTKGRRVGVYYSWSNAGPLVSGLSGSFSKAFKTQAKAEEFFGDELRKGKVVQKI